MKVVLQAFVHQKYWSNQILDLMVALHEISVNGCQDFHTEAHGGTRVKVRKSPKSLGTLWEQWIFIPNSMAINPIVIEAFY